MYLFDSEAKRAGLKVLGKVVLVVVLAVLAYDYYQVRQLAVCAHNNVVAAGMHK